MIVCVIPRLRKLQNQVSIGVKEYWSLRNLSTVPRRRKPPGALRLPGLRWLLSGWRLRRAAAGAVARNAAYCGVMTTALLRGMQLDNCGYFGVYFPSPLRWYSPLEDLALVAASWALMRLAPMAE